MKNRSSNKQDSTNATIHLITGGQRSGKSSLAQQKAMANTQHPIYLATSRIWDDDFRDRVERHQKDRGSEWTNLEEQRFISNVSLPQKAVIVLDCITLWLTNIFYENKYNLDESFEEAKREWDRFIEKDIQIWCVTNEIGMGVHAETANGRKFVDLQGWMNQYIAQKAQSVTLMVSGIEVKIK